MKKTDAFKRRAVVAAAAVFIVGAAAFVGRRWFRPPAPMVGQVAQPLSLRFLANAPAGVPHLTLQSGEQHILVLDMFETTCGPCKKSLPNAQYRFDAQSDVRFVAVCLDEDRAAAEGVASAWGLTKAVAWDEKGEARKQFKVVGIPATVVIAPNGVVTGNFGYEPSDAEMERALRAARGEI